MRRSAAFPVISALFLALPLRAVESEFRAIPKPGLPIVKTAQTPPIAPGASSVGSMPQLGVVEIAPVDPAAAAPETPLAQELGLKADAPLTQALSPVSDALTSHNPGQSAGDLKNAAAADWARRETGILAGAASREFSPHEHNVTLSPSLRAGPKSIAAEVPAASQKMPGWLKNLKRSLDARSKAESWFWRSLFASALAATAAPILWGATSLGSLFLTLTLSLAAPTLALTGITAKRLVDYLRRGSPPRGLNPPGRWKRATLAGMILGLALGSAPFILRAPLAERLIPVFSRIQTNVRHVPGTAMQDELVRRLSANPVGRQILDGLRDRGGVPRLPSFFVSDQKRSLASHHVIFDGLSIDESLIVRRGWTVAEFLRDPEKQVLLVRELDSALVHELTHAVQARRWPVSPREVRDLFTLHLNFQSEYEAFLNEHFYAFERLKADPHASFSSDAFGAFLAPIDDLEAYLEGIASAYRDNKNIDTAFYRAYFAKLRADWPAHAVDCNILLARRFLPKMPGAALMHLNKARGIAEKHGFAAPQLDIPGLTAGAAK